ncbi:hypothetical protein AB0O20_35660 [Streptomyces kronopolitis]|uniref:hypothetical protein n=1 Tax=Streptomyces kronopolitis TaxID=1612435 RepID=UPI003416AC7C
MRCKVGEWIGADTSSGMFLGYGYFELFPKGEDWVHKAADRGWIELQLWAKEPWQVERWDTDGTAARPPKRRPTRPAAPKKVVPGPAPAPRPESPTAAQPARPAPQQETGRRPLHLGTSLQPPTERSTPAPPGEAKPGADLGPQQPAPKDAGRAGHMQHAEDQPSAPKPETAEHTEPAAEPARASVPAVELKSEPEADAPHAVGGPVVPPLPPYPPDVPSPRSSRLQGWLNRLRGR